MRVQVSKRAESAVIELQGRFDFSAHRDFRSACEKALADAEAQTVDVDMAGVTYVDSSALGMLLVLLDKAKAGRRKVSLSRCTPEVQRILEVANFGRLFSIG